MLQMIQANWLIFIAALLIGIVVAYWVFVHGSRPAQRQHRADVLDEGAAPAQRNQALIDSAPAASFEVPVSIVPPAMAGTMMGLGEIIAVAAQEEAQTARMTHPLPETPPQTTGAEFDSTPAASVADSDEPAEVDLPAGSTLVQPVAPAPTQAAPLAQVTPAGAPVSAVAPAEGAAGTGEADDLRRIKGLGPKMQTVLTGLGVTRYAQIAAWSDADLDALDARLGAFAGRPRRDNWVEQARLLAGGDTGAYEAKFGKI